jgi:hypothetical protein
LNSIEGIRSTGKNSRPTKAGSYSGVQTTGIPAARYHASAGLRPVFGLDRIKLCTSVLATS